MKELKTIIIIIGAAVFLSINDLQQVTKDIQKQVTINLDSIKSNWIAIAVIFGICYIIYKRKTKGGQC
jgi:hypothetical protein